MKKQVGNKLRGSAGFTLVELVVVIAIIGILAGVGTVGYGGYIKKANEAADEQLISAVNTAFSVACAENGTDTYSLSQTPSLIMSADKAVTGVTVYNDSFVKYYNEDGKFKTEASVVFVNGVFRLFRAGESLVVDYGGGKLSLPYESVQALKGSVYYTGGVDKLLDKVANVSDIAAAMLGLSGTSDAFKGMIRGDLSGLALALGVPYDPNDTSEGANAAFESAISNLLTQKAQQLAAAEGKTLDDYDDEAFSALMNKASDQIFANNAVLNAAQNTVGKDKDALLDTLKNGFTSTDIKNMIDTQGSGSGLSQAALAYGMYTAYAQRNNIDFDGSNMTAVLDGINSSGFQDYIRTPEADSDIAGYMGAMEMLSNSTGTGNNSMAVTNLLINGFSDQDLQKLLVDATK